MNPARIPQMLIAFPLSFYMYVFPGLRIFYFYLPPASKAPLSELVRPASIMGRFASVGT